MEITENGRPTFNLNKLFTLKVSVLNSFISKLEMSESQLNIDNLKFSTTPHSKYIDQHSLSLFVLYIIVFFKNYFLEIIFLYMIFCYELIHNFEIMMMSKFQQINEKSLCYQYRKEED